MGHEHEFSRRISKIIPPTAFSEERVARLHLGNPPSPSPSPAESPAHLNAGLQGVINPAPLPIPPPPKPPLEGVFFNEEKIVMDVKTVPEMLREAAAVYEERQKVYGYNYLQFGHVMLALFPNGIEIATTDQWNRFGVFIQMITKITRYASQITADGHDDSLLDLSVYANMLRELHAMEKARK